ncbi:hypothetical protein H1R20_g10528, partial [Candolleomyces eurysporus]
MYLTSLSEEVSEIWSQRWRSGKILFLAVQYSVFLNFACYSQMVLRTYLPLSLQVGVESLYKLEFALIMNGICAEWPPLVIGFIKLNAAEAIPSFPLDERFGYACNFQMPSKVTQNYWIVLRYVNLSRTAITACISIATLIIRYRRQNGSLINVIRRDGAIYYLGTIAIRVTDSVVTTSGFITILTEYRIVEV